MRREITINSPFADASSELTELRLKKFTRNQASKKMDASHHNLCKGFKYYLLLQSIHINIQ